jgi:hypothetical protein
MQISPVKPYSRFLVKFPLSEVRSIFFVTLQARLLSFRSFLTAVPSFMESVDLSDSSSFFAENADSTGNGWFDKFPRVNTLHLIGNLTIFMAIPAKLTRDECFLIMLFLLFITFCFVIYRSILCIREGTSAGSELSWSWSSAI